MDTKMTLGEITAEDYRTAIVFKKHNMDFCCGGKKTLKEACEEQNLNPNQLIEEIKINSINSSPEQNYSDWRIDFLADYIVNTHHTYVHKNLGTINEFLDKTVNKHSEKHPELIKISHLFLQVKGELLNHMQKEEQILFPYIKKLTQTEDSETNLTTPMFGSIKNPIAMMEQEHEEAGNAFQNIRSLSNNLIPPNDACKTYQITYTLLNEFEENLHLHIHLENNILFPKAISLEEKLLN